jgi:hypothetical protein
LSKNFSAKTEIHEIGSGSENMLNLLQFAVIAALPCSMKMWNLVRMDKSIATQMKYDGT